MIVEKLRFKYNRKFISFTIFYDESKRVRSIRFEGPSAGTERVEFNRACVLVNSMLSDGVCSSTSINRSLDRLGKISSPVLTCIKKVVKNDIGLGQ